MPHVLTFFLTYYRPWSNRPLLTQDNNISYSESSPDNLDLSRARFSPEIGKSEVERGKIMGFLSAAVILLAWILFISTAWMKLAQSMAH